jgi:hypothetical protein
MGPTQLRRYLPALCASLALVALAGCGGLLSTQREQW